MKNTITLVDKWLPNYVSLGYSWDDAMDVSWECEIFLESHPGMDMEMVLRNVIFGVET